MSFITLNIISIGFIVLGIMFNMAKRHEGMKKFIESYLLGGSMNDESAPYHNVIRWFGWPSIALGFGLMIPPSFIWDLIVLGIFIFVLFHVRLKYREWRAVDTDVGSEVVAETE